MKSLIKILLLVMAAGAIPFVTQREYFLHLMVMSYVFVLLTSSLNILSGYIGILSLAHVAFWGIGAYTSALLSLKLGLSFWASLLGAGLVSSLIGVLIGLVTLHLRGAYFVLVTFAFGEIVSLFSLNWISLTNGPMGLGNIPPPQIVVPYLGDFRLLSKTAFFYLGLTLVILTIFLIVRLTDSPIGRAWLAIRENEELAESVSINTFLYKLLGFIICVFFAGIAGSFYAHYVSFISPEMFAFDNMIILLIMLVVGGEGTIVGPILGGVAFTLIPEYLRELKMYRLPIYGMVLTLAVIFFPRGIMNALTKDKFQRGMGWLFQLFKFKG